MTSSALAIPSAGIGLVIATIMSVVTVIMEVARKKAVAGRELLPVLFWCHVFDSVIFVGAWGVNRLLGHGFYVHGGGDLFGITGLHLPPLAIYIIYQFIDQSVHGFATWLFFKALQEGALSVTIPFLAFSSVLLIPMGFLFLGELPGSTKIIGVVLATGGGVMMHWRQFAFGWLEPIRAIYRDKGSRYMVYTCVFLAFLSPLDKKLSVMTDIYTQGIIFGFSQCFWFVLMSRARREKLQPALRSGLAWIAAAGLLDGASILLQFASYAYIDVVIVISIKRAGIILSVLCGWLFFRERNISDRLIASTVIFIGVTILYLPMSLAEAALAATATVAVAFFYMYRRRGTVPRPTFEHARIQ